MKPVHKISRARQSAGQKRRDEQRLGTLYGIFVLMFVVLIIYFLPLSTPSKSWLFYEGKTLLLDDARNFLREKGLKELATTSKMPDKVAMNFELPPGNNGQALLAATKAFLTRKGFQVRKIDHLTTAGGFTIFVDYQTVPVGSIAFIVLAPTTATPRPVIPPLARPRLVIIIDDFGYSNGEVIKGFLRLSAKLTVSIVPGHPFTRWVATNARESGKEVIIHMPMQPEGEGYRGGEQDYLLTPGMSTSAIEQRLESAFREIPEAVGLNNHMGSLATADPELMRIISNRLRRQGLYFIDSLTSPRSVAYEIARQNGVPAGLRTVFLDNERDKGEIVAQFDKAILIARRSGKAIAIGHVHPETLEVLRKMLTEGQFEDLELAYASEIVQ